MLISKLIQNCARLLFRCVKQNAYDKFCTKIRSLSIYILANLLTDDITFFISLFKM